VTAVTLPAAFSKLNGFVGDWALPTERLRRDKRAGSTLEDLQAFAAAVGPCFQEIGQYLDGFPMGRLEPPQRRLLDLALMYSEVAFALEFYHRPEPVGGFPRERFIIRDVPQPEDGRPGARP